MTQREEFEAWWEEFSSAHEDWRFADSDALRWATWQAAQAAQPAHHLPEAGNMVGQPAQNEWKEAVIEQLAAHSMDAPASDSPTVILKKVIDMAVLQATDPSVNGGWKLVPVEPTHLMCVAARGVPDPVKPYPPHFHLIWDAMLAAAPSTKEKNNE